MHHANSPNKELNELRRQFMVEKKIIEVEFKVRQRKIDYEYELTMRKIRRSSIMAETIGNICLFILFLLSFIPLLTQLVADQ